MSIFPYNIFYRRWKGTSGQWTERNRQKGLYAWSLPGMQLFPKGCSRLIVHLFDLPCLFGHLTVIALEPMASPFFMKSGHILYLCQSNLLSGPLEMVSWTWTSPISVCPTIHQNLPCSNPMRNARIVYFSSVNMVKRQCMRDPSKIRYMWKPVRHAF